MPMPYSNLTHVVEAFTAVVVTVRHVHTDSRLASILARWAVLAFPTHAWAVFALLISFGISLLQDTDDIGACAAVVWL